MSLQRSDKNGDRSGDTWLWFHTDTFQAGLTASLTCCKNGLGSTLGSNTLENGCRMMTYAAGPSFLFFDMGLEDGHFPTFWHLLQSMGCVSLKVSGLPGAQQQVT